MPLLLLYWIRSRGKNTGGKPGELEPEVVYSLALHNQPQQKADEYYIKAAQKFVSANKAAMLPTVSLFGSLGTTYTDQTQHVESTSLITNPPVGKVTVGGTDYTVFSPASFPAPTLQNSLISASWTRPSASRWVCRSISDPQWGKLEDRICQVKGKLRNYELQQHWIT